MHEAASSWGWGLRGWIVERFRMFDWLAWRLVIVVVGGITVHVGHGIMGTALSAWDGVVQSVAGCWDTLSRLSHFLRCRYRCHTVCERHCIS